MRRFRRPRRLESHEVVLAVFTASVVVYWMALFTLARICG